MGTPSRMPSGRRPTPAGRGRPFPSRKGSPSCRVRRKAGSKGAFPRLRPGGGRAARRPESEGDGRESCPECVIFASALALVRFFPMTLHVFNPGNDSALACPSPHFIPPASARRMADDLSALPAWWAAPGDAVCVASPEAARRWAGEIGGICPEVRWVGRDGLPSDAVVDAWGWSPSAVLRLSKGGVDRSRLPDEARLACCRDLSNRRHAVDMLARLRSPGSDLGRKWGDRLCGVSHYCTSEGEIARMLRQYPETLLKAPWSGSGRGLCPGRGAYAPPLSGWCRRLLREQGGVVVEPLYDKVSDFALEFYADGTGGVRYAGLSVFRTTARGAYAGNWVAPEEDKVRWLAGRIPLPLWQALKTAVTRYLAGWIGCGYGGHLGVDMMLCRVPEAGLPCVHPCVEINLRRTMGQVSVDLASFLAPSSEARFVIGYGKEAGRSWSEHCRCAEEHPLCLRDGKVLRGYLPLAPVTPSARYRAALWVFPKGRGHGL